MTYADLAVRVGQAPSMAGATRIIAVDGPAGSGKSVFAERLGETLSAGVICLDDLTPSWSGPDNEAALLVQHVLAPLSRGLPARYHFFDWVKDEYTEWRDVPPRSFLIVEGVGAGSRVVRPYLTFLVWVEAPSALRLERGLVRDGHDRLPEWQRWRRREDELFEREATRAAANLLVNGAPTELHEADREFVVIDPKV